MVTVHKHGAGKESSDKPSSLLLVFFVVLYLCCIFAHFVHCDRSIPCMTCGVFRSSPTPVTRYPEVSLSGDSMQGLKNYETQLR